MDGLCECPEDVRLHPAACLPPLSPCTRAQVRCKYAMLQKKYKKEKRFRFRRGVTERLMRLTRIISADFKCYRNVRTGGYIDKFNGRGGNGGGSGSLDCKGGNKITGYVAWIPRWNLALGCH